MWDDLTHLIALTIDRSDWIISEISRGKRRHSPVPFLNGELFEADSQICLNEKIYIYILYIWISSNKHFVHYTTHYFPFMAPSKRENQFHILYYFMATNQSEKL